MSDRPIDDPQPSESSGNDVPQPSAWHPADEEPVADSPWHGPGAAPASEESEDMWHTPDDTAASPVTPPARTTDEDVVLPGGWHIPDTPDPSATAMDYIEEAVEPGSWYVPENALGTDLLDGVDDTIVPRPEPVPVDEETGAVLVDDSLPADEFGDRLLVDDSAEDDEFGSRILIDDTPPEAMPAAEDSFAAGDSASIAAQMAARLDEGAQPPAGDTFFPQEAAEDQATTPTAADVAAQMASQYDQGAAPSPEETSALGRVIAQFDNVEEQVQRLRIMFSQGQITRDQLQEELRKLMILDEQGVWWMIGMESNTWYRYDDNQWVEAQRPRLGSQQVAEPAVEPFSTSPSSAMLGETQESITLDEYNMPVVHRNVPVTDTNATLVGAAAIRFDELPPSEETMPAQGYQSDAAYQPAYDTNGQPDYGSAYAAAEDSDLYVKVREEQSQKVRRRVIGALIAALIFGLVAMLIVIAGSIIFYMSRVNRYNDRIEALSQIAGEFQTTRIYDVNNNLLTQINDPTGGTRISVPLDQISPFLIHATISVENERFYEDPGWDAVAIARAAIQNLQEGAVVSGASTITQQLARALVLESERRTEISVGRKMDEVIIAAEIGRRYTKNEILELYLNEIYYGNLAYGAEAAAQTYFGISARDLNLPQSAFLAGLVGAPATFDPVTNREAAFSRMNAVLDFMTRRGCIRFQHEPYSSTGPFCIGQPDVEAAVVEKARVEIREYAPPTASSRYPHFVNFVAQQLEENYGLADIYRAGFNVFTTIDPALQDIAQQAVRDQVAALQSAGRGGNNASVVVMDPRDGRILAMVGSADYGKEDIDGQVNVAFSPQQPGSSIKPFVYLTAFQGNAQGQYLTPASVLWDTNTCWGNYCPVNYSGRFTGPHSVRSALGNSLNLPAVKALDFAGVDRFAQVAQTVGLTFPGNTPQEAGLPGALGAFDVRLYDMVMAYGVLANNGKRVEPYAITGILDNEGNPIPLPQRAEPRQVVQPEHAYLLTHILADDGARRYTFGANSLLNVPGYTVAVKTGTTNENRDNWAIGYAPNVVVGVWHGNTDNTPMAGTSGFSGAGPIWNTVISAALAREAPQNFAVPANLTTVDVCIDSGTQPSADCLNRGRELAVTSQLPPGPENDIFRKANINTLTGLIANEFCPNFVEERVFLNISDPTAFGWINNTTAGQEWATQRNIPLPALPTTTEACSASTQQPIIGIDWPIPNAEIQGLVEVQGRVFVFNFNRYQLEFGIGVEPDSFSLVDGPYTIQHNASEFLGRWDVSQLPNGPYTLRLNVVTNDGHYANLDYVVMVNNPLATETPLPTVQVITQTPTASWTPLIPVTPTATQPFVITATPPAGPIIVTNTPLPLPQQTALPPHDSTTEVLVVYGAVASGAINDVQVANYYRFEGQAGDTIEISAQNTAGDLDTLIYLQDAVGNILAEDDDGGTGTDSRMTFTLPASGQYVIVVTRFDITNGYSSGEYRMSLLKLN